MNKINYEKEIANLNNDATRLNEIVKEKQQEIEKLNSIIEWQQNKIAKLNSENVCLKLEIELYEDGYEIVKDSDKE